MDSIEVREALQEPVNAVIEEIKRTLGQTPPELAADIVERGINWTIDFGEDTIDRVKEYHPDVLNRVIKGLQERNYKFKNKKWLKYNK